MTPHPVSPGQTWRRKADGRAVEILRVTPEQIGAWCEVRDVERRQIRWVSVFGLVSRYEQAKEAA